jgi:HPt (histidine-containing phosphotransfer) domain-containing protein
MQAAENVINKEELMERVDGDYELLKELISIFIEELPQQLRDIEGAINNQDSDKLRKSAHRLKGAVGNLAAEEAYEIAAQMELLGSRGELSSARYLYSDLKKQLKSVLIAMKLLVSK